MPPLPQTPMGPGMMPAPPAANPMVPPDNGLDSLLGELNGQQADPTQEAVWDTFPGTDPDALRQLAAATGGRPDALMGPLEELFTADRQKLDMMHQQQLQSLLEELMRPPDEEAIREPAPGVGGENMGF